MTSFFGAASIVWALLAVIAGIYVLRRPAPYGRHSRSGWGPELPATWGWVLMEAPSPILMAILYVGSRPHDSPVSLIFLAIWESHYIYRAFVYPLRLRGRKPMPLAVIASGLVFNCVNAGLNGWWLFELGPVMHTSWLVDPRFLFGCMLFGTGFLFHVRSDRMIDALRRRSPGRYEIPTGGLFRWVSCPNYFGELVEWCGWALLTWSPAGALFALWTAANLVPRSIAHHAWYRRHFDDYPTERRAMIPFVL